MSLDPLGELGIEVRCLFGSCKSHGSVWSLDAGDPFPSRYFVCPTDGMQYVRTEYWLPWPIQKAAE